MLVKDILKITGGQIFSIGPDALLPQAVGLMVERDIGSLLVMEKGKMTGLLTFREVLAAVNRHRGDIQEVRFEQVMVREPVLRKSRRKRRPHAQHHDRPTYPLPADHGERCVDRRLVVPRCGEGGAARGQFREQAAEAVHQGLA